MRGGFWYLSGSIVKNLLGIISSGFAASRTNNKIDFHYRNIYNIYLYLIIYKRGEVGFKTN
jgi:hypothetical protein